MKRVLITMGNRNETITEAVCGEYRREGYEVIRSEADTREQICGFFKDLNAQTMFDEMIYIVRQPEYLSVMDEDFYGRITEIIDQDLRVCYWWLQETVRKTKVLGLPCGIVLLNHISSVVPTQKYSYCSTSQAAMANMAKVAAVEAAKAGMNIRINTLVAGWNQENRDEEAFIHDLEKIHAGDSCPILEMVSAEEIAQSCFCLNQMRGATGSTVIMDRGYSVTRQIREVDYYKKGKNR